MDDIAEVKECEESLRLAMLASDVPALTDLIDERLVFTGADGAVLTREQDLSAHGAGLLKLTSLDIVDASFHRFDGMIVSTTKAMLSGSYGGTAFAGTFAYTRLWSRSSGPWRVIAGHASAIG